MNIINPDLVSITTHHLTLGREDSDKVTSSATGFIYKLAGQYFLITNRHVVTGIHSETGVISAIPTVLLTMFHKKGQPGHLQREKLQLYMNNDPNDQPVWFEHPEFGKKVDVVAMPLAKDLSNKYDLFPINEIPFDDGFKAEVADEAFVVGYPFFDTPYLQLPIWKKGSIATEPAVNIDQLPKLLLDTATRPGMSGSPVILQRIGIHGIENGQVVGSTKIGRIRWFLGVYSGRRGVDEFNAQLGIVWKAKVVEQIITGGVVGSI